MFKVCAAFVETGGESAGLSIFLCLFWSILVSGAAGSHSHPSTRRKLVVIITTKRKKKFESHQSRDGEEAGTLYGSCES